MAFLDIVTLSLVEIFGNFNLVWYTQTNQIEFLYKGILGYIGVIYFLIQALRGGNLLYVNGMWDSLSTVFNSIAAYVLLGDRLKTNSQYVGLFLVVIGIYLLKDGAL
jgi:multidrug transporter EmrE-like cation transporter